MPGALLALLQAPRARYRDVDPHRRPRTLIYGHLQCLGSVSYSWAV